MTTRAARREFLRDRLIEGGIDAHASWPGTFVPPVALVGPDPDRYQTFEGAPYGHAVVNLLVTLIGSVGVNDEQAGEIEDLIDKAYVVLCGLDDFTAGDVTVGNYEGLLAASISVSCEIRPEEYP